MFKERIDKQGPFTQNTVSLLAAKFLLALAYFQLLMVNHGSSMLYLC